MFIVYAHFMIQPPKINLLGARKEYENECGMGRTENVRECARARESESEKAVHTETDNNFRIM